jgi:hypothetical protein
MQLQKFRLYATAQVTVKAEEGQYNSTYPDASYPDREFSGSAWSFVQICPEF